MPVVLYFCNKADRTCWPVKDVTGNPTPTDVSRKSGPFRNQFQSFMQVPSAVSSVATGLATAQIPGKVTKLQFDLTPTSMAVTPTIGKDSDDTAGEDLRQSALNFTHWEVTVVPATGGDPTTMLISMDEYPDGYSNRPPSWWEDPEAA